MDSNITTYSFPNIYENKYYECIEFLNINEKAEVGFQIYLKNKINAIKNAIFFLSEVIFQHNIGISFNNNKEEIFSPLNLINEHINNINILEQNKSLRLKKSYIQFPLYALKIHLAIHQNIWYFKNIYGCYFSFCKGSNCLRVKNYQKAKYFYYLNIIDKNKNLYSKNHYLFVDFIFSDYSSDDVYPIFSQMDKEQFFVHYLTENIDIYNKYCFEKGKCLKIILVNRKNYLINGDFLQKYLSLILMLKGVISGGGTNFDYINNIFYNIEYITYICVGHGVSFFKYFLYKENSCYGKKRYDKLLIPPSKIFLQVAKKYGWEEENIIKMNLPRWDKYDNTFGVNNNSYSKSIFVMFTWRDFKKHKSISKLYFKNIFELITNKDLIYILKEKKINIYFTLHHMLKEYINIFRNIRYINYINENNISHCLSIGNLIISDFSSIIFDFIYKRKPFIIYIPDAIDPEIKHIYQDNYYGLINSLKNGTISFENKFFEVKSTIKKILYYIKNDFNLEPEIEKFYNNFNLKKANNTINNFINYLKALH